MFNKLTSGFSKIIDDIKNRGKITESRFNAAMDDIRLCLLEADVALEVVEQFILSVKEKAIGQEIFKSVSPADMITKIINDELINILKVPGAQREISLKKSGISNILLVGLQGSGKTTSCAKLAYHLKQSNKKILLVSLDIYRPSAREQLQIMAQKAQVESLEIIKDETIAQIIARASKMASENKFDVVIYDSAGRTNIDQAMIEEAKQIEKALNPAETMLVLDSMIGQDSINITKSFDQALSITSLMLSRVDGDSRGGVALSARIITNKPIKFLGTGEKIADLEIFDPERVASRILDRGDIVSLVEKAEKLIKEDEASKAAERMKEGKFNFNDYISQIKQIRKLGGITSIVSMLPGAAKIKQKMDSNKIDDDLFKIQTAIISSMTKKERRNPNLVNNSRKQRMANGSGASLRQVNDLYKQHQKMYRMVKKAKSMDMGSIMGIGT